MPPMSWVDVWVQSRQGEPDLAVWGQSTSRDVGSQKEAELGAQGERPTQGQHLEHPAHVLAGNRSPVWAMWHILGAPDITGKVPEGAGGGKERGRWRKLDGTERKEGQVGPAEAQEGEKQHGHGSPRGAQTRKPRLRDVSYRAQPPCRPSPLSCPQVSQAELQAHQGWAHGRSGPATTRAENQMVGHLWRRPALGHPFCSSLSCPRGPRTSASQ